MTAKEFGSEELRSLPLVLTPFPIVTPADTVCLPYFPENKVGGGKHSEVLSFIYMESGL